MHDIRHCKTVNLIKKAVQISNNTRQKAFTQNAINGENYKHSAVMYMFNSYVYYNLLPDAIAESVLNKSASSELQANG